MKKQTARFLCGVFILLISIYPWICVILAFAINLKLLLLIFGEVIWLIASVMIIEYGNNRWGGDW